MPYKDVKYVCITTHLEKHLHDVSARHGQFVADALLEVLQNDHGALRVAGALSNADPNQGVETVTACDPAEQRGSLLSPSL